MSSLPKSNKEKALPAHLGDFLRLRRGQRGLILRQVAAAVEIDVALLSKIELGQRLPTPEQTGKLAAKLGLQPAELEARRITEKFWRENAGNPAAADAALMIQEAPAYAVNKSVNKRGKTSG